MNCSKILLRKRNLEVSLIVSARESAAGSPDRKFTCKVISHPKLQLRACDRGCQSPGHDSVLDPALNCGPEVSEATRGAPS